MKLKYLIFLLFIVNVFTSEYKITSILLLVLLIFQFTNNLGKKLVLLETIALYSCIIYLIFPLIGYKYYSASNPISKLWVAYMKIPEYIYFDYAVPGILLFILGLYSLGKRDEGNIVKGALISIRNTLPGIPQVPVYLMGIGIFAFYFMPYVPDYLHYVFTILFFCSIAGVAYLIFNGKVNAKGKALVLLFGLWILYYAVMTSMFTIIVYMGILFFSLLLLKFEYSFIKKVLILTSLLLSIVVLQFTKANYRVLRSRNLLKESPLNSFVSLYVYNFKNIGEAKSMNSLFPIYVRVNQGNQLAAVMKHIPAYQPHDNGQYLSRTILASIVPRLFWPEKPRAGGHENMKYYANVYLDTTSMNVGPIGEGYGAFGKWGGSIFMFLFGLFLSLSNRLFINWVARKPLVLLWFPLLFYQVIYCMENDTMQAMNSLIKMGLFLMLLFYCFPSILGVKRKVNFVHA